MRVIKISLPWLLTLLLLAACNPFSKNKPEDIHFRIFETTDIHGSIFPFDFVDSTEVSVSLAQIYSLVRSEREQDDQEVMKSFPGSSGRNSGMLLIMFPHLWGDLKAASVQNMHSLAILLLLILCITSNWI